MNAPKLRPYQKAAVEFATKNLIEFGNSLLVCATGGGKGHSPDMIIPTPDGFRRWGDLRVGDKLFGCDGKPQHIKRIFPRGLQPFYRIKFASGAEVECDSDHIWQMSNGKKFTTHELWLRHIKNGRKYLYDVPYCEPLDYPEQKFMISPYTMGVLIGDGYLCGKSVCFSNPIMDIEIKNRVESELPDKFYLSIHNWGCPQYTICKPRGDYRNAFYNEIINMGLSVKSSDKFIPKQYLVGSVRQRMDLLAGLLDTDGSCQRRSKHSSTTFSTTSVRLANNVADLVRSLGGWASVKTKTRGEICVHIQTTFNPFYLSRKSNKWNGKRTKNYIREIEYIGCKQSICVSVSNQDQLYITDGYVVTHNTAMLAKVAEFLIQNAGCRKVYCIVGTDKVNQQNKETIRKFAPGIAVSEYSGRLKSQHGRIICMMQQTANIHYMNLPAPEAVLIDECFVKGTKIATPFGEKNIEKIKVGDKVFCFNEKSKKIEVKKVEKTYKNPAKSMMRVNFGTQMIQCTTNHPFYTKRGWVQAKDLKENDYILQLVSKGNHKFNKTTKGLCSRKRLLLLLQRLWPCSISEKIIRNNGKNESKIRIRSNARTQPHEATRSTKKSIRFIKKNWISSENTGRKWERIDNPTRKTVTRTWKRMVARISYCNSKVENSQYTEMLQGRHCESEFENSNRNRRSKPFGTGSERARPEKNTSIEWVRVDSIKILEPRNYGKFVYNFAVNKHHNYFANGILVHNCHHARAATYESLIKYWKPKYVFGATATPDRGDKKSLATLFSNFYQISSKELIDMNYLCRPVFIPFECNIDSDIAVRQAMMKLPLQPGKTIHFCRNHEYAKRLYDIITGLSMECAYLRVGGDNDAEYAKFASADCNHLVNVNIATEGFDEPRIMNVVNWCADGTRGRMIQKYGRGLRPYKTKKQCLIFDCGGNIEKYGNLEYTEILPKELVRPQGQFLRIEDLFYEKPENMSGEVPEIDTTPKFAVGAATMPYSPPDGWFSFYDADFGTVFLRLDGRYARFVDNGEIREICIRQDNLFELDDFDLPGAKKTPTDYLNSWQLKSLTDIPTFGFSPEQADAVIAWKIWKKG